MLLSVAGITQRIFDAEDFRDIYNFNTIETLNILGCAGSDISEMVLQGLPKQLKPPSEKKKNRTLQVR